MKQIKTITIFSLTCLIVGCSAYVPTIVSDGLLPFYEEGKYGYIDSLGKVIIKPSFLEAYAFSEGLGAARLDGNFGYISPKGEFVLPPVYDFAYPFEEGRAKVYIQGKPAYIDKSGKELFRCDCSVIENYKEGYAKIITHSEKYGVIDRNGRIVIDTLFSRIEDFRDGRAIVHGLEHSDFIRDYEKYPNQNEVGVIDTLGNFIIPYHRYDDIIEYSEGSFLVDLGSANTKFGYYNYAILKADGKLIRYDTPHSSAYVSGSFNSGLAPIDLYKYWNAKSDKWEDYSEELSYQGFINQSGEVIINDTNIISVHPFSHNLAFIEHEDEKFSVINTKGEFLLSHKLNAVHENGFRDGIAFVREKGRWGILDTNLKYILEPRHDEVVSVDWQNGNYYFSESHPSVEQGDIYIGVADFKGNILVPAIMKSCSEAGFINGLLSCEIDEKLTYVNRKGEIVWQAKKEKQNKALDNLNIAYMNRGYFYAYSLPEDPENIRSGGWYVDDNFPQKISDYTDIPKNKLSLRVDTNSRGTIYESYHSYPVFVLNVLDSAVSFEAQDSRLYMKVQAKDQNGAWRDIEYLPSSWCGDSYHRIELPAAHYWKLQTPIYEGGFKTKLRIALEYIMSEKSEDKYSYTKELEILYSNEYDGSVNLAQFWRKHDYYPASIMDPYLD